LITYVGDSTGTVIYGSSPCSVCRLKLEKSINSEILQKINILKIIKL